MSRNRGKAIIAVFGGSVDSGAIIKARELGAVLAGRHHILLTGGTKPGMRSVKEAAILGVGEGSRIGVDRAKRIDVAASGGKLAIYTNLGHKRNYLEACLCDAAIGLQGEYGTISEVTFSLALQRPVVFFGNHWKDEGSLDDSSPPAVPESWIDGAFNKVGREPSGRRGLDELLNETAIRSALAQLPPYRYLVSSAAPEAAVDWIEGVLQLVGKGGYFPPVEGYERVSEEYEAWLSEHAV